MKNIYDNEVPKYKKKKHKTIKKSKHKHKYEQCLLYVQNLDGYMLADYCVDCNKIYNKYVIYENTTKVLTKEEILEKYKHLSIKNVLTLSDKYLV